VGSSDANARLGNRLWRIELTDGRAAVQKLFQRRRSALKTGLRIVFTWLSRAKTSPTATGRRVTEAQLLRLWSDKGFDVPELVAPHAAGFAAGPFVLMEYVAGPTLLAHLLADEQRVDSERDGLLVRFGADWSRRHHAALEGDDVRLLHEHGSLAHVLICDGRLVTFDLEQGFLAGRTVLPLIGKELLSTLRSLAKSVSAEVFAADLAAIVRGYDDDALLAAVVAEARHSSNIWLRTVNALDRMHEGDKRHSKARLLDALDTTLVARAG